MGKLRALRRNVFALMQNHCSYKQLMPSCSNIEKNQGQNSESRNNISWKILESRRAFAKWFSQELRVLRLDSPRVAPTKGIASLDLVSGIRGCSAKACLTCGSTSSIEQTIGPKYVRSETGTCSSVMMPNVTLSIFCRPSPGCSGSLWP